MLSISCDTMEIRSELNLPFIAGIEQMYCCGGLWFYKVSLRKLGVKTIDEALQIVREEFTGAQQLILSRVDLKFDDNETPYKAKYKLHRLLLSLAATRYTIKNIYMNADYITGELLSCKIDTDFKEAEYYNKRRQKQNMNIESRFEVRSKRLGINLYEPQHGLQYQLIIDWLDYFMAAATAKTYTTLKAEINKAIISQYDGTPLMSYIARFKDDIIFDRAQIKDLFAELGRQKGNKDNSADVQATRFLNKHKNFEVMDIARINSYIHTLKGVVANATQI